MQAFLVLSLLLPLSAALPSLQCVNKCMGEPQLIFLTGMIGLSVQTDFDSSESRETPVDPRKEMCNHGESIVKCLEACETSDQQEYFHEWSVKWHSFACNGTEEELRERTHDMRRSLECFDDQQELLLVKAAAVLMARGANPNRNAEENLCDIAGAVAKAVSNGARCPREAKMGALEFIEHAYRWLAMKLGIEEASEECENFQRFARTSASFTDIVMKRDNARPSDESEEIDEEDESNVCMQKCIDRELLDILFVAQESDPCVFLEPVVSCFQDCPANKLQEAALNAGKLLCGRNHRFPNRRPILEHCFDIAALTAFDQLGSQFEALEGFFMSGANSSASEAENLCDIFTSTAVPILRPLKGFVESTKDPKSKDICTVVYEGLVSVAAVPLRVAALKLGISQEEIRCDDL